LSGSVAFGVPDPLRTEELVVVVVADDTITDGHEVSAFVAERLARWKAPRYVSVVREPFPRLPSGKIDRRAVADSLSTDTCWDRERETPAST
jgi:acyl-CoA synthetase (AMP-forming)/AMP-acid ligase II